MTKNSFLDRFSLRDGETIAVTRKGSQYYVKKVSTPFVPAAPKLSRRGITKNHFDYDYYEKPFRNEDPDAPRFNPKTGQWEL